MKYFTFALLILLAISCEIIFGPGLPAITSEGKGTFGCLVNDTVFVPKNSIVQADDPLRISFHPDDSSLYITAQNFDEYITISLFNCCNEGKYELVREYEYYDQSSATYSNGDIDCYYETNSIYTGNFGELEIIRFDTVKQIVAGKFHFNAVSQGCDTLNISEGRFDLVYRRWD